MGLASCWKAGRDRRPWFPLRWSLQTKPGSSSRSTSESDQPLFLLGREDFILDVLYKQKSKPKIPSVEEDSGQADTLWLVSKGRDLKTKVQRRKMPVTPGS